MDALKRGLAPPYPGPMHVDGAEYLYGAFLNAGLTSPAAMGDVPLTWPDLWAFSQATGDITEPWEFETLREMSAAYISGRESGANPLSIPPAER